MPWSIVVLLWMYEIMASSEYKRSCRRVSLPSRILRAPDAITPEGSVGALKEATVLVNR